MSSLRKYLLCGIVLGAWICGIALQEAYSQASINWKDFYGGGENEYGEYVAPTIDGGFIIAGATCSYGDGTTNVWLVKTDEVNALLLKHESNKNKE